jgi:hypothetical protein
MLATYHRGGGDPPKDDESLDVEEDGSFVLIRTVGGPRVGTFAGKIPRHAYAALARLVAKAGDFEERPTGLPPHVMESLTTSRADIEVGVRAKTSNPATKLVRRMRELSEDLTAAPVAALELSVAADGSSITMTSVGSAPVEAAFGQASLTYTLFGEGEELLSAGEIAGPLHARTRARLDPGWTAELAITPDLQFNARRTLDVKVEFDLYDADGRMRRARLRAISGKGWSR